MKRSVCEEVRNLGTGKIVQLERQEKICKDEDSKRTSFLAQAKRQSDRRRLAALTADLAKFDLEMTCTQHRPAVTESIALVKTKLAQIELKRHGCFSAATDGVMSEGTRSAAKLFLAKIDRGRNRTRMRDGETEEANNETSVQSRAVRLLERTARRPTGARTRRHRAERDRSATAGCRIPDRARPPRPVRPQRCR